MRSRRTTSGAAIVLGIVAALLAACSSPAPQPTPTMTTVALVPGPTTAPAPNPTPSLDPTISTAEAAILEVYRGYWRTKVQLFAAPNPNSAPFEALWTQFALYAVDTAQSDVYSTAFDMQHNGIVVHGQPVLTPSVSDIVPGQSASITDCVDSTNWQPIYAATGKSAAAPGQAARLVTNSTVVFYDNRWVVNTSVVNRDTTC